MNDLYRFVKHGPGPVVWMMVTRAEDVNARTRAYDRWAYNITRMQIALTGRMLRS